MSQAHGMVPFVLIRAKCRVRQFSLEVLKKVRRDELDISAVRQRASAVSVMMKGLVP